MKNLLILALIASMYVPVYAQEELIGEEPRSVPAPLSESKSAYTGFTRGSQMITPGLFFGSSLIGVDYEIGLSKVVGIQIGGGMIGADAGVNLHFLPKRNFDMYVCLDANYLPGLNVVAPGINLGIRGLFGSGARAGIGGEIGVMISTVNRSFQSYGQTVRWRAGQPLFNIAIGAPIRIR